MVKLKSLINKKLIIETAKHGFDLTDFDRGGYQKVLKGLRIPPKASLNPDMSGWVWKGNGITIVTANNPITGDYYTGRRRNEKDYASYIGIQGRSELVMLAVKLIKQHGDYKDESPGRRAYI